MREVGIASVSVCMPMCSPALGEQAPARSADPQKYRLGLGPETMAIAPRCEDAVALAVRPLTVEQHEAIRAGRAAFAPGFPDGFEGRFFGAGIDRDRRRHLPAAG